MRIEFEHPAIVGGKGDDGASKHALVRIKSDIEIAELTEADAPVALVIQRDGMPSEYLRHIEGKLYKHIAYAFGVDDVIAPDSLLYRHLIAGSSTSFDFDPFWMTIKENAHEISLANNCLPVENLYRKRLLREAQAGYTEVGKACLTAPTLRKWRWLASDVDHQLELWREIAREKLANVVLVDGMPHVRCFEPCYVLTQKGRRSATVGQTSRRAFQREIHRHDHSNDGLELMWKGALELGSHYFSALDIEGMKAFAQELGWAVVSATPGHIKVLDESAVSTDFFDIETVRHARILMECGEHIVRYLDDQAISRDDDSLRALENSYRLAIGNLHREVISWQDKRDGVEALFEPISALESLILEWGPRDQNKTQRNPNDDEILEYVNVDGVKSQIAAYRLREEQATVHLDVKSFIP